MKGLLQRIWPVGLLLALCMLVLPGTMLAAEQKNDVYVNGVDTAGMARAANADTIVAYPVTGGNIYFDTTTGTITDCDISVTDAVIPEQINGVAVTNIGENAFYECDKLVSINIPNSITNIGEGAFWFCSGLKSIIIPNSVKNIDDAAFNYCSGLTNIIIPDSVSKIGNSVFAHCTGLINITIPDNITSIDLFAFSGCSGLTSIKIPDSVTSIGSGAFENCSGLTSIIIPDGVTSISYGAFDGCSGLMNIIIPDGVTDIDDYAFRGCNRLTGIKLPGSVSSIGSGAFEDCSGLTSIIIPDGVTDIDNYAFRGCTGLTNIIIPKSVASIGDCVFQHCTNLFNIVVDKNNINFCSLDGVVFNKSQNRLILFPPARIYYEIPNSVTSIANGAFDGCSELTSVIIPDSVISIGNDSFRDCSGLTSITIPDSVTSIGSNAFMYCSELTSIKLSNNIKHIGYNVFSNCSKLTDVIIPDGVIDIDSEAFSYCSGLKSIIIPDSVTSIGSMAFEDCNGLTSITIPNRVPSINWWTFRGCSSLKEIVIPDSITSIAEDAFQYCDGLTDVYYSGSETQWNNIVIDERGNDSLKNATIHYNSAGPDNIKLSGSVNYLVQYNADNKQLFFGNSNLVYNITEATEIVGADSVEQLVDKYVLVETNPDDIFQVTKISAVESKIGVCSEVGTNSLTVDGVSYATPEDWILDLYAGKQLLYHINDGKIVGAAILLEEKGIINDWNNEKQTIVIDGKEYYTNFLTDTLSLKDIESKIGQKATFQAVNTGNYSVLIKVLNCQPVPLNKFEFSANLPTNCIKKGSNFTLNIGYYENGELDSSVKDYVYVVSDNSILDMTPIGWNDEYGQRYNVSTKKAGYVTITVTNPKNSDYKSLELYIVDGETGYTFDSVPKMSIEKGKTTNFYNFNGLVIDNFRYTAHKNENNEIDYYVVNMTVYNTLDLYAAVTAFNGDGQAKAFSIIDKQTKLPSNFVGSVKDLYNKFNDLLYLINNSKFYSGESVSKKTEVEIEVPVGGYIEISNGSVSDVATLANVFGLMIDGVKALADLASDSDDMFNDIKIMENKSLIIEQSLIEAFEKDYVGSKVQKAVQEAAIDELKNANWNYDNYGVCLENFVNRLNEFGLNLTETLTKKIVSVTGVASITESVVKKVLPTGQLIDWLYDAMGIGEQVVAYTTFKNSVDFGAIYIYAPNNNNLYKSNGVDVIPDSITESDILIHSYKVIDENEVDISDNTFAGNYETYSITMYRNGQKIQPNATVTVRIPLSDTFKTSDISKLKVYRHNDNGSLTDMNANIVDGYAVFTTDHFSYYTIVDESSKVAVSSIALNRTAITLNSIGAKETLLATVLPENATNKSVTWSSSNTSIVTVDENGVVTVVGNGTATITATTVEGNYKATCEVKVNTNSSSGGNSGSSSSGGSGSSSSKSTISSISIPNISNGGISITPKNPLKGDTVTLNIVPDNGYELEQIKVTDTSGKDVKLNKVNDKKYTFIMPDGKVRLDVSFRKITTTKVEETKIMPFTDVKVSDWFYNAVTFAYENNLMNGETDTLFKPNNNLNRAMLVTILYRLENSPSVGGANNFNDVVAGQWYTDAVVWASANGIVNGYEDGTFLPMQNVSREEMVAMLMRYAKYKGYDVSETADLNSYADRNKVSAWALSNMQWANGSGLIKGDENNKLNPQGSATRAEAAMILMRFVENISK